MKSKPVLVLSPHTDDGELGAGGTVARLVEAGAEVHWLAFSPGTANDGELLAAMAVLGIPADNVTLYLFETRRFPDERQAILQEMVDCKNRLKPGLVLCPSRTDGHQDHQVIAAEAQRAFKQTSLLGWEQPWNCRRFDAQALVRLTRRQFRRKMEALACYQSQQAGANMSPLAIISLARVRGMQAGCPLAEGFEVIRWVW